MSNLTKTTKLVQKIRPLSETIILVCPSLTQVIFHKLYSSTENKVFSFHNINFKENPKMVSEEPKQSPPKPKEAPKQPDRTGNCEKVDSMFSPRFRSVAAMAGWDEEALLIASLVVEDTPDREFKQKRRSDPLFKTPPTNSRRKRRAQRKSLVSIPVAVLNLDEDETTAREENGKKKPESKMNVNEEKKIEDGKSTAKSSCVSSSSSGVPCLDRLREELSCAICLEICFEPSTTPCGHSFCKKCLRSAADKCGKRCPKCRQLISNGRSCTVNTVLWNTIQLLFPEVEARKASGALNSREAEYQSPARARARASNYNVHSRSIRALSSSSEAEGGRSIERVNMRNRRSVQPAGILSRGDLNNVRRRRGGVASQDEDAALALRLQREEFMDAFRGSDEQHNSSSSSIPLARANLRAMASRAINIRLRGRPT